MSTLGDLQELGDALDVEFGGVVAFKFRTGLHDLLWRFHCQQEGHLGGWGGLAAAVMDAREHMRLEHQAKAIDYRI